MLFIVVCGRSALTPCLRAQVGLRRTGFGQDAMQSIQCVVAATLEVYLSATRELRPTPAKSHYVFNLRDVSRVVQGCSLARKESVDSKRFFVNLWTHEVSTPLLRLVAARAFLYSAGHRKGVLSPL